MKPTVVVCTVIYTDFGTIYGLMEFYRVCCICCTVWCQSREAQYQLSNKDKIMVQNSGQ